MILVHMKSTFNNKFFNGKNFASKVISLHFDIFLTIKIRKTYE